MQEAPVIPVKVGLLKRIAESMVNAGVIFYTSLRNECFQLIENLPGQSPSLLRSD